jgi:hypothetical protein
MLIVLISISATLPIPYLAKIRPTVSYVTIFFSSRDSCVTRARNQIFLDFLSRLKLCVYKFMVLFFELKPCVNSVVLFCAVFFSRILSNI